MSAHNPEVIDAVRMMISEQEEHIDRWKSIRDSYNEEDTRVFDEFYVALTESMPSEEEYREALLRRDTEALEYFDALWEIHTEFKEYLS